MKLDFLQHELIELENHGIYRSLKEVHSPQGREITLDGQRVLNFSSNDYLGLANDERIKKAAQEAISQYGFGSGASRLISGNMIPHQFLEEDIARLKKTESSLVFSSGYMANTGIIPALIGRKGVVISDKLNHASMIDGIILSRAKLLRYPHADMHFLEKILKSLPAHHQKLIVTDSVFSMDGDRAPLKNIVELAKRYQAFVMVDEAHGFGVLGEHGGGLTEELGLEGDIDIQMGTLSKAAGCFGAYVCGSKELRDYLINKSRSFIYTTAIPPCVAEASRRAVKIIQDSGHLRQDLQQKSDYVRREIKAMGFDTMNSSTPIIPVLVKDSQAAVSMSRRMLEKGIFVQAIRPPTVPVNTSRLRITLMATHTQGDLEKLLSVFKTM